jgi:hypothetical protein
MPHIRTHFGFGAVELIGGTRAAATEERESQGSSETWATFSSFRHLSVCDRLGANVRLRCARCPPVVWPDPPPGPVLDIVIRPASVDTINLGIRTSTVPIALGDDATLRWATLDDGRLIMGGRAGLFDIQTNTVVQTSSIPVRDLAVDETYGFIVSNAEGLYVYDGFVLPSQLGETLVNEEISVLMSRGDEMWLAGDTGVHRLENKILHTFDGMNDIVDLLSFEGGSIVAESSTDGFHVLRSDTEDWEVQSLSEELTLSEVVPGFDDRIMQIHTTEEACHLCFARHWLRLRVPQLPAWKRWILKLSAPFLLGLMARDMLDAPPEIIVRHRIPSSVIRAAFTKNATHRESVRISLSGVRELCREMGLIGSMTRHLWRWAI